MTAAPVSALEQPSRPMSSFLARRARWVRRHLLIGALLLLLIVLIALPIIAVLLASFSTTVPGAGEPVHWVVHNYAQLWSRPTATALRNSLLTSAAGTILAIALGGALALLSARTNIPARWVVEIAGITPFFFPPLIGALAWGLLGRPQSGLVNVFLASVHLPIRVDIQSAAGVIFIFGIYYAPYAYLLVSSALRLFNPQLEEAARVHGASTSTTLRRVTVPILAPAVLGAALICFTLMMEDFSVPALLNTKGNIGTLATRMYTLMEDVPARPNEATAIGVLLLAILVIVATVQRRILGKRQFTTLEGKGIRAQMIDLGRFRWPALGLVTLYLLAVVVVPFLALVNSMLRPYAYVGSIKSLFDTSTITFAQAHDVLTGPQLTTAFRNTVVIGAAVAVLGTLLSYLMAYLHLRTDLRGRGIVRLLAIIPLGIPAILMGMGILWTWLYLPVPIYGTLVILVLAFISRFTPQGFLSASSVIGAVHKDLEDSAMVSGASRPRAMMAITAPLVRGGVGSTMLLLFLLASRELSVALFLFTSKTVTFSIQIYSQWFAGRPSQAAALSVMYSLFLFVVTMCGLRWLRGPSSE